MPIYEKSLKLQTTFASSTNAMGEYLWPQEIAETWSPCTRNWMTAKLISILDRSSTDRTVPSLVAGKLTEREFVEAFENCSFPANLFHHAEHVRLVWLYLREGDIQPAAERMLLAIRRFATSRGVPEKFHYTLTLAWVRLVADATKRSPCIVFEDFLVAHPELLNRHLPNLYYSDKRLESMAARTSWVEPDIAPLP